MGIWIVQQFRRRTKTQPRSLDGLAMIALMGHRAFLERLSKQAMKA